MKVIVQIVNKASVTIEKKEVASIQKGFLLFVGFTTTDSKEIADKMIAKLLKARIFPDDNGLTNLSISQINGEIISVSQFSLYASLVEGNRPSFTSCLIAKEARVLYDYFLTSLKSSYKFVQSGIFQEDMKVSLVNNGPFTIILDSKELWNK